MTGVVAVARGLVREARPWQWYKQSMLLLGIVFSQNLASLAAWGDLLIGVVSFSLVASATYVYNDISDLEADRNHPVKRNRPMASGLVDVRLGAAFGAALFLVGVVTAYLVDPLFLAVVCLYLGQNALYSLVLKRIAIVDIIVIAVGFVLRAVAGVVAIGVSLSPWLVVCTFLAALVLALGKRRHEMRASDDPAATRDVLGEYTADTLDQYLVATLATLLVSYSLYTFFGTTETMMVTLPFAFFGSFRYHHLVYTADVGGDPVRLFDDRPFVANLLLWSVLTLLILYGVVDQLLTVAQTL